MKRLPKGKNVFPKGWDEQRVRRLIAYYDRQSEAEAIREYRALSGKRAHIGSSFDDFLKEEGILAEVDAVAIKRAIALQTEPRLRKRATA